MDDIQNKAKGLINKFSNQFKPKFKGQGHKLGGGEGGLVHSSPASSGGAGSRSTGTVPAGNARTSSSGDGASARGSAEDDWRKKQAERWQQEKGPSGAPQAPSQVTSASESTRVSASKPSSGSRLPAPAGRAPAADFNAFSPHFGPAPSRAKRPDIPAESTGREDDQSESQGSFQCPVCGHFWRSEAAVQSHVEECLARSLAQHAAVEEAEKVDAGIAGAEGGRAALGEQTSGGMGGGPPAGSEALPGGDPSHDSGEKEHWELHQAAATLFSASPPPSTLEIVAKLLRNILNDPSADKFRRIRMGNPKIAESVGKAVGGVDFLQAVGFHLSTGVGSGDEMEVWAVMEDTSDRQLACLREALSLLEAQLPASVAGLGPGPAAASGSGSGFGSGSGLFTVSRSAPASSSDGGLGGRASSEAPARAPPRKADRRLRVFLPAPESMAARIEVPEAFFGRSAAEVRSEMMARKKALENSQMLVTRALREKQAAAARRRYTLAIMRVQLPDMMVLEGLFYPAEPASHLYEFVAEALLDPSQEFQLVHPIPTRSPFIPSVAGPKAPIPTLEELDMVPAALVKFRAVDMGQGGYTGLRKELILQAQPLTSTPYPAHETGAA